MARNNAIQSGVLLGIHISDEQQGADLPTIHNASWNHNFIKHWK
jgi:hypothetical protein